jgi:hypothetical protein
MVKFFFPSLHKFVYFMWQEPYCHNLNFGIATKARICKGAGQEWSSGVTFHAPRNVGECEGMNPNTPKWAATLGVGVPMHSSIFKEQLKRSKLIGLKKKSQHWKNLRT